MLFIWPLKHNLDIPWVMSLQLASHLPRLVAMVALLLCVKEK